LDIPRCSSHRFYPHELLSRAKSVRRSLPILCKDHVAWNRVKLCRVYLKEPLSTLELIFPHTVILFPKSLYVQRPSVCITGGGTDHGQCLRVEKNQSEKNSRKRRRFPNIQLTLCYLPLCFVDLSINESSLD
jgi:hypothetical protein